MDLCVFTSVSRYCVISQVPELSNHDLLRYHRPVVDTERSEFGNDDNLVALPDYLAAHFQEGR